MNQDIYTDKRPDLILLKMLLFYGAVNNLLWRIFIGISSILGIYISQSFFDNAVWIMVIIYLLRYFLHGIKAKQFLIYLLAVIIVLVSYTFTNYEAFTDERLVALLMSVIPCFFCGAIITIYKKDIDSLYKPALIVLIVSFGYMVFYLSTGRLLASDNMDQAYRILPAVLIVLSKLLMSHNKKVHILPTILGVAYLLLMGTRGPLLCTVVFVAIVMIKKEGFTKLIIIFCTLIIAGTLILNTNFARKQAINIAKEMEVRGFSSRFVIMFIEGNITDANGRNSIRDRLVEDIKEAPFKIRGLYADREATRGLYDYEYTTRYINGSYAHNLVLEIVYDWGILIGGLALLIIFYKVCLLLYRSDKDLIYFIAIYVVLGIIHLMVSGSYLENQEFFILLGLTSNPHMWNKKKRWYRSE